MCACLSQRLFPQAASQTDTIPGHQQGLYMTRRAIPLALACVLSGASLEAQVFPDPVIDGFFRVATWNIRFFPQPTTDADRVAEIILGIDADVLAVQEITDANELQEVIDTVNARSSRRHEQEGRRERDYDFRLTATGGGGGQFVGIIFDRNAAQLISPQDLTSLRMSPGLRPALHATVRSRRGGLDFQIIANHTDSGRNAGDYQNRQDFSAALATEIDNRASADADYVVLGDLNTMGRSSSGGVTLIQAEQELAIMDRALWEMGLRRLPAEPPCSEYFQQEGGLLDHIIVSVAMREVPVNAIARVFGYCRLLQCRPYDPAAEPRDFTTASDHCPVVVDLIDENWG